MSKYLVIVESPSKAKTINKYLGKDYDVLATVGHIKNLPESKFGVDIENDYEPDFETIKGKDKVIKEIRSHSKKSEIVYIATDPDREGEAIAIDISDEIEDITKDVKRILFEEITKSGVKRAMGKPTVINKNLVNSQTARRVMDRILGYKVSPFLWKTFYYGLSAGRVQSVALKLICERESEIDNFEPKEYWSIDGIFSKPSGGTKQFSAKLYKINADIIKYNGEDPRIKNIEEAHKILEDLKDNKFKIIDIQTREVKRNPQPPFTTSMLQQAASTRLGFSPKKTMMLAQKLYEGVEIKKGEGNIGLITYMRTDSTRISPEAVKSAREFIAKNYGEEYVPETPNIFSRKSRNAQEAHEAIRPADINIRPEDIKKLDKNLHSLYTLIWNRFIASQMEKARINQKTVLIKALSPKGNITDYIFKATGSEILFHGFMQVYREMAEDLSNNKNNENGNENILPELSVDDFLKAISLSKNQHFTNPPPRYTESSLIKQLDSLGIGRPSTYALIVSTVIDRKYVELNERKLFGTKLGIAVNKILSEYFPDVINFEFTANMEEELDTIANGDSSYKKVLDNFYKPFIKDYQEAESKVKEIKQSLIEKTDILCPECGDKTNAKMLKKWGRNGLFLTCERYPKCKASMNDEDVNTVQEKAEGVICDKCGAGMILRIGRFGKFFGCSNYPKCSGTKPFTLGIKCPKCNEGDISLKMTKNKRIFYGCTKYPDCNFITNYEPIIKECKKCGNNYLEKKKDKEGNYYLQCPSCKAKYEIET
ncbi:MAG: type I DNA topoisomerase [Ignavibacteria bacterium]|nr:type I DNA topoisomerase [Ignavibacteria bacterium]